MKVRIIKTSAGYIPQVYKHLYGETDWFSLSCSGDTNNHWSEPKYIYRFCTHYTQWGAMKTLKRYLKVTVDGTRKLEAFTQELKKPNVVYEAEV